MRLPNRDTQNDVLLATLGRFLMGERDLLRTNIRYFFGLDESASGRRVISLNEPQIQNLQNTLYERIGRTPDGIKQFMAGVSYDFEQIAKVEQNFNAPLRSALEVLADKKAICIEAALAADSLLDEKYNSSILYLEKENGIGHAVCAYQDPETGLFGAIGVSRHKELTSRNPIYETQEELAQSYDCDAFKLTDFFYSAEHRDVDTNWNLRNLNILTFFDKQKITVKKHSDFYVLPKSISPEETVA
ncbi:hypothetical protein KY346_01005 [Candidatus Woesearchaeota archaeon]|nr:hypothetical protein [Candidatus Woesearchaeota archaeon]